MAMAIPPPSNSDTRVFEDARDELEKHEARMARISVGKRAQSAQRLRGTCKQVEARGPVELAVTSIEIN